MEIAYAFFAEAAQMTSDGRLNLLGADLHTLQFEGNPPWTTALYLVVGLRFQNEEGGRLFHLTGDLVAPDETQMAPHVESAFVAPVPSGPDRIPRMTIAGHLIGIAFPVA